MNPRRLQAWILRLVAAAEMLAFIAAFMPRSWMEAGHRWLGLGEMPDGPLVNFIVRQTSFTWGLHGVALWLIATDVVRYRPLVILTGLGFLAAAPAFVWFDASAGMPWSWIASDGGACFVVGALLLWLEWRAGRQSETTSFAG